MKVDIFQGQTMHGYYTQPTTLFIFEAEGWPGCLPSAILLRSLLCSSKGQELKKSQYQYIIYLILHVFYVKRHLIHSLS